MKRLLLLFIIFIGLVDVSNADAKNLLVDSTHKGNEVKISSSDTIHHFLKVMGSSI
ncbi:hypothetical protein JKY79_01160 [Candidatus Babeliales bacterium]|nr:hypothetical protein [Candidatus Babeliales bacterium]